MPSSHAILLRAGWPHVFKKVVAAAPAADGALPSPMVSYAGDTSYIGATYEVACREMATIVEGHQQLRRLKVKCYAFWQLACWCLISVYGLRTGNDAIIEAHLRAVIPYVEQLLLEEEKYVESVEPLKKLKRETMDKDSKAGEWICSECHVCLWNLVVELTNNDGRTLCGPCAGVNSPRQLLFRFGETAELRRQFDAVKVRMGSLG